MRELRQVIWGLLAALVSLGILLGSLSITLVEGGLYSLVNATPTLFIMLVTQPIPTLRTLGQGVQTATATSLVLETPRTTINPAGLIAISPTPRCSPPEGWTLILVDIGDSLESIAQAFNISEEVLKEANCLEVDNLIAGTELYVPYVYPTEDVEQCGPPAGWVFYTVKAGDTLSSLSRLFGVTVSELQFANCLGSSTLIRIGQKLYVPDVPIPTIVVEPTDTTEPEASATMTSTFTPTREPTASSTPTRVPTQLPTNTTTSTSTPTLTNTPTPFATSTTSNTPTNTVTNTPTLLPTSTSTQTPLPSNTPTMTPSPTMTEVPQP